MITGNFFSRMAISVEGTVVSAPSPTVLDVARRRVHRRSTAIGGGNKPFVFISACGTNAITIACRSFDVYFRREEYFRTVIITTPRKVILAVMAHSYNHWAHGSGRHNWTLKLKFCKYSSIHTNYIIPHCTTLQCFAAARLTWLGYGAGRKRENCSV